MPCRLPARASRRRVPALTHDPSSLFQPPEVVGPFRVRRVLASGTLGPRLLVEDDRGRLQALKLITDIAEDADALAQRLEELRHALPLHPALLPVTDVGSSTEGVWLASPVLTAPTVEGRLHGGRQSLEATLHWLRAVTEGVQAAHDAGHCHGAIHPRDVLVTEDGGVLTGVGVAPVLEQLELQAPVRVPFTAPERASGRPWDARADQYSLAMLALDALSGRRLIAGTIPAFDRWILAETPAEDARLHEVFARALDPDSDRRYPSVAEWLAALAGPDIPGESQALSRFARDGVILSASSTPDSSRDGKGQSQASEHAGPLSLFPEEDATTSSPVAEASLDVTVAMVPGHDEPEREQEWLVSDVPDEGSSIEPDADPFVMRHAPVPAAADAPADPWRLGDPDVTEAVPVPDGASPWEPAPGDASDRRPWVLAAVVLGMAVLGYGTWRSLQEPASVSSAGTPSSQDAQAPPSTAAPAASPAAPALTSDPGTREAPLASPAAAPPTTSSVAPSVPAPVAAAPVRTPASPVPTPAIPPAQSGTAAPAAGGRVLIRSSPAGDVRVNGVVRGQTPVVLRDLPYGDYAITITRPGFEPARQNITLLASQPVASLSVDLVRQGAASGVAAAPPTAATPRPVPQRAVAPAVTPPAVVAPSAPSTAPTPAATGSIYVTSTPARARLFVDGQAYGSTPASIPGLEPGAHTVRVEAPGYRPWEGTVAVLGGTRARVQATLQQEQE